LLALSAKLWIVQIVNLIKINDMNTILRRKENYYMLKAIESYARDRFKTYYGNSVDPRLLHCNNKMIDLSYTDNNIIYVSSKYKRGVKCGQAYNINNLFYEMVEKKFRNAIIFDCVQGKRLTKELIQQKCNGFPTLYVIEYLKKEYGVISFIVRNNMASSILKKLQYFD
jgi:hypothetical protein